MLVLYAERSSTPSHLLQPTQHHSPKCCQPGNQKGGTPALVSPPPAIQIVVLVHERWLLGKQTVKLAHSIISVRYANCGSRSWARSLRQTNGGTYAPVLRQLVIQIMVHIHECRPRASKRWNSSKNAIPASYTNEGTYSRVLALGKQTVKLE